MKIRKEKKKSSNIEILKTDRYKIYLNEKYKNVKILKNTEVNSNYFYSEYQNSFKYVKHKREENFKLYVKFENNDITFKDMEIFVNSLLKNEEFYSSKEEPDNYETLINERIDGY